MKSDDAAFAAGDRRSPPPDTTIIRLQDPETGEIIVLAIRINGGTVEAVVVSEPH